MQKRSALDSSELPPVLLRSTPRDVRVSSTGGVLLVVAAMLVVGGIWGAVELNRRAQTAARHRGLFASERIVTAGEVVQLRKRGGDDDARLTAHYTYVAAGREFRGATALRRDERNRYAVGSPIAVWYLKSEPEASWLHGHAPRPMASWPATAVPLACGVAAMAVILLVRRQWNLLAYGRPAIARVTKVDTKKSDKGTIWVVHYEFTAISGAKRTGKYNQGKKDLPAVGTMIPIVYHRDNTFRHSKYPMRFVSVRENRK